MQITISSQNHDLRELAKDLKTMGYRVVLYTPQKMVLVTNEPQEQVLGLISLLAFGAITVTVANN